MSTPTTWWPSVGEPAADTAGAAPGVEDPSTAARHGVDEAGLAAEIVAFRGHRPEPFDVPRRMTGVLLHETQPAVVVHAVAIPSTVRIGHGARRVPWPVNRLAMAQAMP